MKKFIVLSALVAATSTAFVACSSDDDLAQQPKAPETTVANCPFNFVVSMNNGTYTRGAGAEVESDMVVSEDMDVTRASAISSNPFTTDGNGFELWGYQAGQGMILKDGYGNGKAYTYNYNGGNPYWSMGGEWPTTDGTCYFYALSYAGSNTPSAKVSTKPQGDSYNEVSFVYEMPLSAGNIDLSEQEDLLVAHSVTKTVDPVTSEVSYGTALTGQTSGDVNLNFGHALSNLEIKIAMPVEAYVEASSTLEGAFTEGAVNNGWSGAHIFYIKTIIIHNLPTTGTYTFGTGWGSQGGYKDIVIDYPDGRILYPLSYDQVLEANYAAEGFENKTAYANSFASGSGHPNAGKHRDFEKEQYESVLTGSNSVMVIPHEIGTKAWTSGAFDNGNDTYIEIKGFFAWHKDAGTAGTLLDATQKAEIETIIATAQADEDLWLNPDDTGSLGDVMQVEVNCSTAAGKSGASCNIPLPDMEFEANKKYTFYITVTGNNTYDAGGDHLMDGI